LIESFGCRCQQGSYLDVLGLFELMKRQCGIFAATPGEHQSIFHVSLSKKQKIAYPSGSGKMRRRNGVAEQTVRSLTVAALKRSRL
jgi:hypothetical protein